MKVELTIKKIIADVINEESWKKTINLSSKKFDLNYSLVGDLGADSLTFAEIIMRIEDIFDISIEKPEKIFTVGDLFNRVTKSC